MRKLPKKLSILRKYKDILYLIELAGFIHDLGKLSEDLMTNHRERFKKDKENNLVTDRIRILFETPFDKMKIKFPDFHLINFPSIETIIQNHHDPKNEIENIIHLSDSKDSSEDRGKAVARQNNYISSVFGIETKLEKDKFDYSRKDFYKKLDNIVNLVFDFNKNNCFIKNSPIWYEFRKKFVKLMKDYFSKALAETRRAANDVNLYNHSYMTGVIAKNMFAKCLMQEELISEFHPNSKIKHFSPGCDLELLCVSINTIEFLKKSEKILDVRGRLSLIDDVKQKIKKIVECELNIGSLIYEDEESFIFLIPIIKENILDYLEEYLSEEIIDLSGGLLKVFLTKSKSEKFFGNILTQIKDINENKIYSGKINQKQVLKINQFWNIEDDLEKCPVCQIRPKKINEKLCSKCSDLRKKGIEFSLKEDETAWIDEIADKNGKVVYLLAFFHPFKSWLSGEFLRYQKIKTLRDISEVTGIKISNLPTLANASAKFVDVLKNKISPNSDFIGLLSTNIRNLKEDLKNEEISVIGGRSMIGEIFYRLPQQLRDKLKSPSYTLRIKEKGHIANEIQDIISTKPASPSRLMRVWSELAYFSNQIIQKIKNKVLEKEERITFKIKDSEVHEKELYFIEKNKKSIGVFWDGENFSTIQKIRDFKLEREEIIQLMDKDGNPVGSYPVAYVSKETYIPTRTILQSPSGFMLLLPADKAFKTLKLLQEEYFSYFSKVIGNISIISAVIFADRKFPSYVCLDGLARMKTNFLRNYVVAKVENLNKKNNLWELTLEYEDNKVNWKIDGTFGDGSNDNYYSYFMTEKDELKHISELDEGEKIKIFPNYYDFELLDSSTRRLDIYFERDKRPHKLFGSINSPRPYLLKDISTFEKIWELFKKLANDGKLTNTKLCNIESLLATKFEEWRLKEKDKDSQEWQIWKKLIETTLMKEFGWKKNENNFKFVKQTIISGIFFDCLELNLRILKKRIKEE